MGEAQIVQQNTKRLFADCSLPDVLMAVELRSTSSLGVIAMPRPSHFSTRWSHPVAAVWLIQAFFADDVVACDVGVAGIDARGDGNDAAQPIDNFGDLLEAAAERKFSSGRVLDQDGQPAVGEIQPLGGRGNGSGGSQ